MKKSRSTRTKITDITAIGLELTDEQLRLVGGGKAVEPHKCWDRSASVVNPGEQDTAKDYVTD